MEKIKKLKGICRNLRCMRNLAVSPGSFEMLSEEIEKISRRIKKLEESVG